MHLGLSLASLEFAKLEGHARPVFGCGFWPGVSHVLASWSTDCTLRLWDTHAATGLGVHVTTNYPLLHAAFHRVGEGAALLALCGGKDALTGVPVYLHHCRPITGGGAVAPSFPTADTAATVFVPSYP